MGKDNLPVIATTRLLTLCAFFGLASFVWGYAFFQYVPLMIYPGADRFHTDTILVRYLQYMSTQVSSKLFTSQQHRKRV
jgi:hypothetical protein